MATKKPVAKEAAKLEPVQIVYKGVDFGAINPRAFLDRRFRTCIIRMKRATTNGETDAGLDYELQAYELLFGADNIDAILDKLAEINGGFVGDDELRDFIVFVMEETNAKNS